MVSCEAPAYLDLPHLSHHWLALTVPQDIPFGLSPLSFSGPPGKLGPFPPTPISPASAHPDTDVPSGELPWHPWGLSSLLVTLGSAVHGNCWGMGAGGRRFSPRHGGFSRGSQRSAFFFTPALAPIFPAALAHLECSQLLLPLMSGLIAFSSWARCSHASLDLLQEWKSRREKGESAAERPIPAPSPRLLPHEAPTKGSAQPSPLRQRAGVCSGRACWGWGEARVGSGASRFFPVTALYKYL